MARPQKPVNWEIVLKRMEAGNTAKSICTFLEWDTDTFYRRFKDEFGIGFGDYSASRKEFGLQDLEYTQHMKALSGNAEMLKWLGKVRLGQREPDSSQNISPNQEDNDLRHENMMLKAKLDAIHSQSIREDRDESQAEQEFYRSYPQV